MTKTEKIKTQLAKVLDEIELRQKYNKRDSFFPKEGPLSRDHYTKQIEFMSSGVNHSQRAFIAPNRSGKTLTGAFELTCHVTGEYPSWWEGRVFSEPVFAWAASVSNEATKNILQFELLGSNMDIGSGMVPKDKIVRVVKKPGVADAVETVYIKHNTGGLSRIDFKSYEQGRDTFQGTKKHVIWLDEEPTDYGIFTECLTRTASACKDGTNGLIYCTFTPLFGLSDVVLSFLPDGKFPEHGEHPEFKHKYVVNLSWEDVPHLSKEWQAEALASYSPHERDARSRGIPALGSGAIYPYLEYSIVVDPFEIPVYWPKAYGLDVGWNRTAAIWGAMDPASKQIYLFSEHYQGEAAPAIHASAIKARGEWITGTIDPKSENRSQADGIRLIDLYKNEGLDLIDADNSVESGIYKVGQMLASGQLKVFSTLRNWLSEYRVYRRDEKGKIIKKNDHLMDATRYLLVTGMDYAEAQPDPDAVDFYNRHTGRSQITGY